jgi:hypothetical protein
MVRVCSGPIVLRQGLNRASFGLVTCRTCSSLLPVLLAKVRSGGRAGTGLPARGRAGAARTAATRRRSARPVHARASSEGALLGELVGGERLADVLDAAVHVPPTVTTPIRVVP